MDRVAGVDGCRVGWVVAERTLAGSVSIRIESMVRHVIHDDGLAAVGIDIPIGLLDAAEPGGRECDRNARVFLGAGRASSVFSPPVRSVLGASGYEDAKERSRRSSPHGVSISRQSFAIVSKIAEVDQLMTPQLQRGVVEVHPEVSFATLNGDQPIRVSKKTADGRAARMGLLHRAWGIDVEGLVAQNRIHGVEPDDVLDAMVACWTAERVLRRQERRFPTTSSIDSRGLRMEIVR